MYNMEAMPKMAIIIIILIATMIKVFNYCKKQYCSLSTKQKFQKNCNKIFTFCRTKLDVSVTAIARLIHKSKPIKNEWLGLFPLLVYFLHALGITISNINSESVVPLFRCLSAWKISEWCMYIPSVDNLDNFEHYSNIIPWYCRLTQTS